MEKKYIIKSLSLEEYFAGANPRPVYSKNQNEAIKFDTEESALTRLADEYEMFPSYFQGHLFTIITIFKF